MEQRDWESYYKDNDAESMPWYMEGLDHDLMDALYQLGIKTGSALDLCTGPGTQAIALAGMGFRVTATDISESAIEGARMRAKEQSVSIDFRLNDMTDGRLDDTYDFVFDRGCFHVLPPELRESYRQIIFDELNPEGYLFLKCFSNLEPMREGGPFRLSEEDIRGVFSHSFQIILIKHTEFRGNRTLHPKALFCIMKKPKK